MAIHRRHHYGALVMGLLLIVLGLVFWADQYVRIDLWSYLWPFVLVCIGLLFFAGMVSRGKEGGALAIPGCIFVAMGLVGFLQAIFNHWASWAYAWTFVAPTSVGIGLIIFGWWSERPKLRRAGLILTFIGLVLFIAFGAMFELLFAWGGTPTPGRILLPLLIIALGLALVFGRRPIRRLVEAVVGETDSGKDRFSENSMADYTPSEIAPVNRDVSELQSTDAPSETEMR